jgi:acylphosphatase
MASGLAAKRVLYEGCVQGVGFRFSAKEVAEGFDVVGWVKNLPDGRVQLEVQGQSSEVDSFLEAIEKSHLRSHIHRKVVVNIDTVQALRGFQIRH